MNDYKIINKSNRTNVEQLIKIALESDKIKKSIGNEVIDKVIITNKIINFVTKT